VISKRIVVAGPEFVGVRFTPARASGSTAGGPARRHDHDPRHRPPVELVGLAEGRRHPTRHVGVTANDVLVRSLRIGGLPDVVVIEKVESYGMAVGAEV
jgi:hypothetical protein